MTLETAPWDAAEFLTDEEIISAYLTEALESDDPRMIAKAQNAVNCARYSKSNVAKNYLETAG